MKGFQEIVDFLNGSHIRYALTKNPTIYVSLIEKFWQTATVRTVDNREQEINATVDVKEFTITEASVRRHLKLVDADGINHTFVSKYAGNFKAERGAEGDALLLLLIESLCRKSQFNIAIDPIHSRKTPSELHFEELELPDLMYKELSGQKFSLSETDLKERYSRSDDMALEDSSHRGGWIAEIRYIECGITSWSSPTKVTRSLYLSSKKRRAVKVNGNGGVSLTAVGYKKTEKMAQVHQAAQGFIEDEWEDIRARVKADEELTQKLQVEERDKYSEVDQARMLRTEDKERASEVAAEVQETKSRKMMKSMMKRDRLIYKSRTLTRKKTHILTEKHDDMVDLHRLVQERYEITSPEGYGLLLLGRF
ncbi:hypothetical protein Tco_1346615 [Tanacetum coccineum]